MDRQKEFKQLVLIMENFMQMRLLQQQYLRTFDVELTELGMKY